MSTRRILFILLLGFAFPLGAAPDDDWQVAVVDTIRGLERHFQLLPDGTYSAPNRDHGLRARLDGSGLVVVPRTSEGPRWQFGLRLTEVSRGPLLEALGTPTVFAAENRVELFHGGLTEWFINDPRGVEQGFTIPSRLLPQCDAPLSLRLEVESDLLPTVSEDGRSLHLLDRSGCPVLGYSGLVAIDASGRELPAQLALRSGGLEIVVEDADAEYPLVIDPIISTLGWSYESNQNVANLGVSVATAGDVDGDGFSDVVVGAHKFDSTFVDEGRAFLFLGSASGPSTTPDWTFDGGQAGALLGISVGSAGDVNADGFHDVIVGALHYTNGQLHEGGAFLFLGSSSGPSTSPDWSQESNQASALFGSSVGTAGDVNADGYADVLVGASQYTNGQTQEGAAFVYLGSASGPSSTADWMGESDEANSRYGKASGTAGDVNGDGYSDIIVGALQYTDSIFTQFEGAVFVYHGSAGGLSTTVDWFYDTDTADTVYGFDVSTAGDVNGDGYCDVIVGTNNEEAAVFHGSGSGLSSTPDWLGTITTASAGYGWAVGTAGDVNGDGFANVIVGAPQYTNGQASEGAAFVYHGSASGVVSTPVFSEEGGQAGARMGYSVATAGDANGDGFSDIIIGAHEYTSGQAEEGRALLYYGSPTTLGENFAFSAQSDQADAAFGASVAQAGDVNGDGYGDVIVGAWLFDNGEANEGRAFVFHGSATGLATTADWTAEIDQVGANFANSVASAGDVDGDGYDDVIVGAVMYDGGETDEGAVFVFLGSSLGLSATADWSTEANQADALLGWSVGSAGDVNGDGYGDIIAGAPGYSNGESGEGQAWIFLGSPTGPGSTPDWTAEIDQANAAYGTAVAAGDVNGDGFSDAVVGAWLYDNGENNEGGVFVYHGSSTGPSSSADWSAEANQATADFGLTVSVGDANGDGYADVLAGARKWDNAFTDAGSAFLYAGSAAGLSTTSAWQTQGTQDFENLGTSVAFAGDLNADGYTEAIIGARGYSGGETDEGRALVFRGSAAGLETTSAWTAESNQADARFGTSVSAAGDVNGDGFGDVIVGADRFDDGETDEGVTFVYLGNDDGNGAGRPVIPGQIRAGSEGRTGRLGMSDSAGAFRLRGRALSASGRAPVAVEWEVRELGLAFDGTTIVREPFYDTGSPGALGSTSVEKILIDGLSDDTLYAWRFRYVTEDPLFPHSPWFHHPASGLREVDLRTMPVLIGPDCDVVRDDDGTLETYASIDYTDDDLEKTLDLGVDPSTLMSARLWIYGQAYNYPGHAFQPVQDYELTVNGSTQILFDVGLLFNLRDDNYQLVSIDIPLSALVQGGNTFYFTEQSSSGDWVFNDLRVGVDLDNDFDRSWWYGNGLTCGSPTACDGELMIFLEVCPEVVPGQFVRGDCNDDGNYDIGDAIALLDSLFGTAGSPPCDDACDANDDGGVDIADAIFILSNLFASGPQPPAPHPNCGTDPTADALGCAVYTNCP